MDWIDFGAVTWWAVAVAFVVTFIFGWFWYSPRGFFPLWRRLDKISEQDMQDANMGIAFGGTAAGNLLGVVLVAVLIPALGIEGWIGGLACGALLGLVLRGGAHAIHNGFAGRHPGVTLIDTAHDTIGLALAGAVLGALG